MIDWKPIHTAPKDGSRVLLASASSGLVGFGSYVSDTGQMLVPSYPDPYWEDFDDSYWEIEGEWFLPTHWAPKPTAPAKTKVVPDSA